MTPSTQAKPYKKVLRMPAQLVSWLFHPVLMPPLLMIMFYYLFPGTFMGISQKNYLHLLLIVFINTTLFSVVFVLICKGLGLISSLQMPTPKERIIPLMGVMIFYFWCNHVMGNVPHVPFIVRLIVLGGFWGVIAMFMVNIFFKLSLHTAAAGAVVALFLILLFRQPVNMILPLAISIIIAGIVGTARMILGKHTTAEIWLGYFVGFAVQCAAYFYLT